jgi:glutamate 5-kinase
VILSVAPGLCRNDPGADGAWGEVIPLVPDLDQATLDLAGTSRSTLGTGGMKTKLEAARAVTSAGGSVIIAPGREEGVLTRILRGERIGTLFLARGQTQGARRRWIGLTARPRGQLVVDAGARHAIEEKGKSLLPIGVVEVTGSFARGDVVAVRSADGCEFARGLCNYGYQDAGRIRGLRTEELRAVLGETSDEEMIHRDHLVLTS